MDAIEAWETFDIILTKRFKFFLSESGNSGGVTTDIHIEPTFQSDFGNFDTVEDQVRLFFFKYRGKQIIETKIPEISEEELKFYFQNLTDENRKFLFKISKTGKEGWYKIHFEERKSEDIYDSSNYFSNCLDRAYEKFNKLADSVLYNFSNSEMNEDTFFEEKVEEFCSRQNFDCNSKESDSPVAKWTITDRNNDQKYSLTISNIQSDPFIFFEKLAPSSVPGEDETYEDGLLIHLAADLETEFKTLKKLFKGKLDTEVRCLLDVKKWFRVKEQPPSWKENYVAIEKVRKQFENMIVILNHDDPNSQSFVLDKPETCEKLKRWFKKLLELHFGLRAQQLRSRKKYKLFYEHRITNAIAEHIMDEPGVNEAFAHFVKILPRHARMRGSR